MPGGTVCHDHDRQMVRLDSIIGSLAGFKLMKSAYYFAEIVCSYESIALPHCET